MKGQVVENIMANTVTNPGARLAGMISDLGHKLKVGRLTEDELALFLKRQNPFLPSTSKATDDAFHTREAFTTRPGLWVGDEFQSRIIAAYPELIACRGVGGVEYFNLMRRSLDRDILACSEMDGEKNVRKYAFTPDQIFTLIAAQFDGQNGKLITNSDSNLFYVVGAAGQLLVVGVRWGAHSAATWEVYAWELDGHGAWNAGDRVFYNTRFFGT